MINSLSKEKIGAIAAALVIFLILYFGFDIVPSDQKQLEKSRMLSTEATSVQNLIMEARKALGTKYGVIEALMMELNGLEIDSLKTETLQTLSGRWYELGYPAISGYYAEEIAKINNQPDAWAIAGTTYMLAMKNASEDKVKSWSFNRAIQALETAVSLNPDDIESRINLALGYIENPQDNPMQGIMMLRQLNEEHPRNVKVLAQLGRLSLVTNQVENAIKRLKEAESIEPDNKNVICLLAQAYDKSGDSSNAAAYNEKCFAN
jgi:tetratricopeptide (TPR) repeat protein